MNISLESALVELADYRARVERLIGERNKNEIFIRSISERLQIAEDDFAQSEDEARSLRKQLALFSAQRRHSAMRRVGSFVYSRARRSRTLRAIYRMIMKAIVRLSKISNATPSYSNFSKGVDKLCLTQKHELIEHIECMLHRPAFTVIVDDRRKAPISNTLKALDNQIYPADSLYLLTDSLASTQAYDASINKISAFTDLPTTVDFVIVIEAGDELVDTALYEFASAINASPTLDLIYSDEECREENGQYQVPFFKPDWSPDYLESFNYIGRAACFRWRAVEGISEAKDQYDFVLRFTEQTKKIHHIRKVLLRTATTLTQATAADVEGGIHALEARLRRTGRSGNVRADDNARPCYTVNIDLKRRPLVSVIVPTAAKVIDVNGRRIDLLTNCISQVVDRSTYKDCELIIVDNGDLTEDQRKFASKHNCKTITYYGPTVNIAKKLNLGASIATGEIFLLLNDDIEVLSSDWIERMLEHFEKPHVGVVGAKLLYPSLEIQHVGVVHNFGNPDHVRRLYARDDPGYFFSTCASRNYMAVTGACMMTPASIFRRLNGYSEGLAISFNDVDYCMKVAELGLFVVYAPKAELIHMESQSRKASLDVRELELYYRSWGGAIGSDPFYNEQMLAVAPPTFELQVNRRMV